MEKSEPKKAALIIGVRQCGKTHIIREFLKNNYENYAEINFWDHPEAIADFAGELTTQTIISNLSIRFRKYNFVPHKTAIFFDEIQECPRARLAMKTLINDFDVIASGSFLGINGYVKGDDTAVPVGYEEIIEMKTMDFEEFLWALNFKGNQIDVLRECLRERKPLNDTYKNVFDQAFRTYMCVGGFPKAVREYVEKGNNVGAALKEMQSVTREIKTDFGRRKNKDGTSTFNPYEVARIRSAFDLMPSFLAKENKRFIVSKIEGGNSLAKNDAIEYLTQCNIAYKVKNVENISLPLSLFEIPDQFKFFPCDLSLMTYLWEPETILSLLNGKLGMNKGGLFEAAVADSIYKLGIPLYYFSKNNGLEIDFVVSYDGKPTLLEVKATNGNTKSSKTVLKNPEHYGSKEIKLIKFGSMNIAEENGILSLPYFMTFILFQENIKETQRKIDSLSEQLDLSKML